jgi:hypothetical protein
MQSETLTERRISVQVACCASLNPACFAFTSALFSKCMGEARCWLGRRIFATLTISRQADLVWISKSRIFCKLHERIQLHQTPRAQFVPSSSLHTDNANPCSSRALLASPNVRRLYSRPRARVEHLEPSAIETRSISSRRFGQFRKEAGRKDRE